MTISKEDYMFWKWPISADEVFAENETCYATVNLRPVVPGHTMVITKEFKHRFDDLTEQEVRDMAALAAKVYNMLTGFYKLAKGCTMGIQDGLDAGQTVNHLHLHILPTYTGAIEVPDPEFEPPPQRDRLEMKEEAESYRAYLATQTDA